MKLNRQRATYLGDASEALQVCERLNQAHQELCIKWVFIDRSLKGIDRLLPIFCNFMRDAKGVPVLGLRRVQHNSPLDMVACHRQLQTS